MLIFYYQSLDSVKTITSRWVLLIMILLHPMETDRLIYPFHHLICDHHFPESQRPLLWKTLNIIFRAPLKLRLSCTKYVVSCFIISIELLSVFWEFSPHLGLLSWSHISITLPSAWASLRHREGYSRFF